MRNIRLHLQYDGTRYKGWQKLKDEDDTIQNKIEKVLSLMTSEDIKVIASGRTDSGVHANMQVVNFHTNFQGSLEGMLKYCFNYLPNDIVVFEASEASENFHSRLNVKEKEYTYKICNKDFPDVFSRKYSYHIPKKLDIKAMKEAAKYLIGEHDFAAYTALKSKKKSTIRDIYNIHIKNNNGDIEIVYTAKGFLYKMIRILTGTLIEVGLHNMEPMDVKTILDSKDRSQAGPTAPSHGLCMTGVKY